MKTETITVNGKDAQFSFFNDSHSRYLHFELSEKQFKEYEDVIECIVNNSITPGDSIIFFFRGESIIAEIFSFQITSRIDSFFEISISLHE